MHGEGLGTNGHSVRLGSQDAADIGAVTAYEMALL